MTNVFNCSSCVSAGCISTACSSLKIHTYTKWPSSAYVNAVDIVAVDVDVVVDVVDGLNDLLTILDKFL